MIYIIFQAKPVTPKRVPNKNKKKPKEGQGIVTKDFIPFQDCKIYFHMDFWTLKFHFSITKGNGSPEETGSNQQQQVPESINVKPNEKFNYKKGAKSGEVSDEVIYPL